jgi:hypothetical protein
MKPSNEVLISDLIGWPIQALLSNLIWKAIFVTKLHLPSLNFWDWMWILVLVGCIFPTGWGLYLQKIADKLYGEE